jgi:hypothetical protein
MFIKIHLNIEHEKFGKLEKIADSLNWTTEKVINAMLEDGIAQASIKMKCFENGENSAEISRNTH